MHTTDFVYSKDLYGPVVIGGVGGSGTRVVAEIAQVLGVRIGTDLNESLDNLTYTLLFKRPRWFIANRENRDYLITGLETMRALMIQGRASSISEHLFLFNAMLSMAIHGHNQQRDGRGTWAFKRWLNAYSAHPEVMRSGWWGWKEPNSHLLLQNLSDFFPGLRFILCIRNGLDMAFSQNQQQLMNWGNLLGIEPPADMISIPERSFRFWKVANRKAIELGNTLTVSRFLLVNFDRLCTDPINESMRIASFIGVNPGDAMIQALSEIPKKPKTTGRYIGQDIKWLSQDDLDFLSECGFSVEIKGY